MGGKTQLYVKADELDENFTFSAGIQLLKNVPESFKFSVSPFRHDTMYSEIFDSVTTKYIPTLDSKYNEEEVTKIKAEWKNRIQFLTGLKETNFTAFDIKMLKSQPCIVLETEQAAAMIRQPSTSSGVALTATFYPMELTSFSVLDLTADVSLVFYSEMKKWRPWIGLFVSLIEDGSSVMVQWLRKEKQNYVLHNKADGTPYLSSVTLESVMFSDVVENMSVNNDREGPYKMQNCVKSEIMKAYTERDLNLA